MSISKQRLEFFTDGVIAIIITIMVLEIPLPESTELKALFHFLTSIVIYLLSFLVVGAFWNQHHQAFNYIEKVNHKILVSNIFFLFFLSLVPLFTKWVIENSESLIPVIGYDIVFVLVTFFYFLMFRFIFDISEDADIKQMKQFTEEMRAGKNAPKKFSWRNFVILVTVVIAIVVITITGLSIYLPKISRIILIGIPITSSAFHLLVSEQEKRKHQMEKEK